MLMVALSMLFLAALLNLVAIQYAQGVVRAALDEGVRMGSAARATEADCMEGIGRVMGDLLGGPMGADVGYSCVEVAGDVVASAQGAFDGWFPGMPNINFASEIRAVKESDE